MFKFDLDDDTRVVLNRNAAESASDYINASNVKVSLLFYWYRFENYSVKYACSYIRYRPLKKIVKFMMHCCTMSIYYNVMPIVL